MKVLLATVYSYILEEEVGLAYISAYLKQNIDDCNVEIIHFLTGSNIADPLEKVSADVVAFNFYHVNVEEIMKACSAYKH